MISLNTKVALPTNTPALTHEQRLMLLGSCFAENIGNRLLENGFCCDVNPFGILYNPLSIATALSRIMDGTPYAPQELFCDKGYWHSFMHHSCFSADTAQATLDNINTRLEQAHQEIQSLNWLLMTWGTSYVYSLPESGQIVSNCHKLPERSFDRRRITPEEIVNHYVPLLDQLFAQNEQLHLLLTVSPIRHLRDGMHANQLSKAVLLLAIDRLCELYPQRIVYFPSYEIVLDELRDYRFYADDMIHVSTVGVDYLWERFAETFFSKQTLQIMNEYAAIQKALTHRPFHPESEQYQHFLKQITLKIERFNDKYPKLARKIKL